MPLDSIEGLIEKNFGLRPVVATEIEFYLHGAAERLDQRRVLSLIEEKCFASGIPIAKAEPERGPDQYEVSLLPSPDVAQVARHTDDFRALMAEAFLPQGIRADFAAKPMRDAPGSGLHVHVHLEDAQGRKVFFREGEEFSPALLNAVGGLLALMNPCMSVFAPRAESYDRFLFTANSYLVCPAASNVPLTASWGTNNRTVAVRLPPKPSQERHIEHRVSGSDADAGKVIAAVLAGMHYGMKGKLDPGAPVYGDASLPQYAMPRLARSLEEAMQAMRACRALDEYPVVGKI